MMKRDWLWVALIVSVLLNVLLAGRAAKTEPIDVRADTIVVRDTVRIVEARVVKEDVVRHDTAVFPMVGHSELKGELKSELKNIQISNELESTSNLTSNLASNSTSNLIQDSAKVVIPISERTYEDSTYRAVVRGYEPELVSLDIYRQQTTVYRQQTRKPKVVVGIGPYAGFGNKGFNYGIAVNVSMPIWSW
jgi:hypothetical protein